MRELTLRFAVLDRSGCCPPLAGLPVAPVVDRRLDMRWLTDVRESEGADEWDHLWIELGGEG